MFPKTEKGGVLRVDETLFDDVFETVVRSPQGIPAPSLPRRLAALFIELRRLGSKIPPDEATDLIWALWIHHANDEAAASMNAAIEAMVAGAFDLAKPILDQLVQQWPDWAEAWNKRATIAFAEKRDTEALIDIQRTLLLEPRHFGAIIGFGQICMRHRHFIEAKAAFEIANRIHPHISSLQGVIDDLSAAQSLKH
jgi:predicted Zn-dependent protease